MQLAPEFTNTGLGLGCTKCIFNMPTFVEDTTSFHAVNRINQVTDHDRDGSQWCQGPIIAITLIT